MYIAVPVLGSSTAVPITEQDEGERPPATEWLRRSLHDVLDGVRSLQQATTPDEYGFDNKGTPVWLDDLPSARNEVVNATLELAVYVAKNGLGEKTVAAGVTIGIIDSEQLQAELGTRLNKYHGLGLNVLGILASENKESLTFVLPGARTCAHT